MLTNIIVLLILVAAVFFIARAEKENLRSWLASGQTELKHELKVVYLFWKEVAKNPIRIIALAVALICQRNTFGMLFTVFIMLGISYYLARTGALLRINWEKKETDRILTYGFAVLGVFWLVDSLSLYTVAVIVAVAALVGGIIYLAAKGELKGFKGGRTVDEDEDEEYDEGYDDEDEALDSDEDEEAESAEGDDEESESEPEPAPAPRRASRQRSTHTDG